MKRFKVQAGDMGPPPPPGRASYMYEKAKQAPLLNCILKITGIVSKLIFSCLLATSLYFL